MTVRPNNIPGADDIYIDMAVKHLTVARDHLQAAVYKFDDAGHMHDPTARAYSFVTDIVSQFCDRPGKPTEVPEVPQHIAEAAAAWRAERDRRRRP